MGDPHKNSGSNDNNNDDDNNNDSDDNNHIGNEQKRGVWESLSIDPSPIREDIVMRIVDSVHPAETLAHCIEDVLWLLSPLLTTPTKSDPTDGAHSEPTPPPPSVGMFWEWEPFVSFFPQENGDPNDSMEADDIINISRRSIPPADHGGNANDCGHNTSSSRRNSSTTNNNASLFNHKDRTMSPSEGHQRDDKKNNEEEKPSFIDGIQFNEMFDSPEDSFADHGVGEEADGSDNDDDAKTIDENDQPPRRDQRTIAGGVHSDAASQTARPARKSTRTAATTTTTATTAATINAITSSLSLSSPALSTVERASAASLRQPDPPPAVSDTTAASSTPTNVRFRSHHPKMWQQRYEELVQYKTQHGHCFVDPKAFKSLSAWTKRQRHQYRRKREGRTSTLTDEREEKLQSINFAWDAHEAIWELRFQELLRFKEQKGHTNVPGLYSPNPQLGIWVKCQRKQYATDQEKLASVAAPSSTSSRTSGNSVDSQQHTNDARQESQDNELSQHMVVRKARYARLESIGFQWIARQQQQQQQGNAEN